MSIRDIGIDVRTPQREPDAGDRFNPFNGSLPVRGSTIVGTVVAHKMQGTVIVERQRLHEVKKFERYEKRTNRYPAHVPSNIDVDVGDEVTIAECRPISKTVKFVVVENRTGDDDRAPALKSEDAKPAKKAAKPAKPAKADAPAKAEAPADESEEGA